MSYLNFISQYVIRTIMCSTRSDLQFLGFLFISFYIVLITYIYFLQRNLIIFITDGSDQTRIQLKAQANKGDPN